LEVRRASNLGNVGYSEKVRELESRAKHGFRTVDKNGKKWKPFREYCCRTV